MKFFNWKKKKDNTPVWRNEKGEIRCLGDACRKECDDSCPIYLNTIAMSVVAYEEYSKAIDLYKQILDIAPDFAGAWNNIAMCNAHLSQFKAAKYAYLKAYELCPDFPGTLFGLALVCKDLKQYEESIQWCDKYDQLSDDQDSNQIRIECLKKLSGEDEDSYITTSQIFTNIIAEEQESGRLHDDIVRHIPELFLEAEDVCRKLYNALREYQKTNNEDLKTNYYCLWAIFAGMGATVLWNENWPKLKEKGIFESLTESKGIFAMDEYVSELLGEEPSINRMEPFQRDLNEVAYKFLGYISDFDTIEDVSEEMIASMRAAYQFGIVFQMDRLKYGNNSDDSILDEVYYALDKIDEYLLDYALFAVGAIKRIELKEDADPLVTISQLAFWFYTYIQNHKPWVLSGEKIASQMPKILRCAVMTRLEIEYLEKNVSLALLLRNFNSIIEKLEKIYIANNLVFDLDKLLDGIKTIERIKNGAQKNVYNTSGIHVCLNVDAANVYKKEHEYFTWNYEEDFSERIAYLNEEWLWNEIKENTWDRGKTEHYDIFKSIYSTFEHVFNAKDLCMSDSAMTFIDGVSLCFFLNRLYSMNNLPEEDIPVFLEKYQKNIIHILKERVFVNLKDESFSEALSLKAFYDRVSAYESAFMKNYKIEEVVDEFYLLLKFDKGKDTFTLAKYVPVTLTDIFDDFSVKSQIQDFVHNVMNDCEEYIGDIPNDPATDEFLIDTGKPKDSYKEMEEELSKLLPELFSKESELENSEVKSDTSSEKENIPMKSDVAESEKIEKKFSEQPEKLFCRKCGIELQLDSIFCHRCGTKVIL